MASEQQGDYTERYLFVGVAVVTVLAAGGAIWKKHRDHKKHHPGHAAVVKPVPSVAAKLPEPAVPPPSELALEIWVKSPDELASKILPRLLPPGTPKGLATFTNMMKNGMPPAHQKDIDELDFSKPLGIAVFDAGRFVSAATVRDPATAKTTIEAYAKAEGAVQEHSNALAVEMYKGAKTGRYLALYGKQVFLGSDRGAVEAAAPRMAAAWALATAQTHDVVAHAPRTWVSGPFAQWAEKSWLGWVTPQLNGQTSGQAKILFDEIASGAKANWPGAEDVDMSIDVGEQTAIFTGTLRAQPNSAFATFLQGLPTKSPDALLDAPRDALGGLSVRFPAAWLETARRFMTTPPPGVEIPQELRAKTELVFTQLGKVLEGEVLFTSVADPPQTYGAGASLMRFKVKNDEDAKKAAKDLLSFMINPPGPVPPGTPAPPPFVPFTVDGGAGEALEIDIPVQPGTPPLPKEGIAWVVKNGYLYVARGSTPKLRVTRFLSQAAEDHVGTDPDVKSRVQKLPPNAAVALFMAPFRADTPLPAAMKAPPLAQAITLALSPSADGVTVSGAFDLDLTLEIAKPMLFQPAPPPPGSLPPDAASGAPPQPGLPPGMPGLPLPIPGAGKPPTTPKSPPPGGGGAVPPPVVPPAGTGYVLPIPKHQSKD